MSRFRAWPILLGFCVSVLGANCSERIQVGRDLAADSAGAAGTLVATAGAAGVGATAHLCQRTSCQGQVYECGDCQDNDADQLIDADDPDCTGPCDNTEDSYFGGIPGQNNAPCRQDCYFDKDSGSGNDQCYWDHACDPQSVAPAYPPSGDARCSYDPSATIPGSGSTCAELSVTQSNACLSSCLPITPNGCDCFGCCELPAGSAKFVWIGSTTQNVGTCDAAHVADPAACQPCTPVRSCFNACDPCEVCVGRTVPAASCATPGSGRCLAGATACGQAGEADCPTDYYCVTGCCEASPL